MFLPPFLLISPIVFTIQPSLDGSKLNFTITNKTSSRLNVYSPDVNTLTIRIKSGPFAQTSLLPIGKITPPRYIYSSRITCLASKGRLSSSLDVNNVISGLPTGHYDIAIRYDDSYVNKRFSALKAKVLSEVGKTSFVELKLDVSNNKITAKLANHV